MLEGLRLSWERVSGGNWNSLGSVVFLLLELRADLVLVVAACGERERERDRETERRNVSIVKQASHSRSFVKFPDKKCLI